MNCSYPLLTTYSDYIRFAPEKLKMSEYIGILDYKLAVTGYLHKK